MSREEKRPESKESPLHQYARHAPTGIASAEEDLRSFLGVKSSVLYRYPLAETVIKRLIDEKHSNALNAKDEIGNTPLHLVCTNTGNSGNSDAATALINYGADVNSVNDAGDTPLHVAARTMACDVIYTLINRGADVTIKNKDGNTAWQVAIQELMKYSNAEVTAKLAYYLQDRMKAFSNTHAMYNIFTTLERLATYGASDCDHCSQEGSKIEDILLVRGEAFSKILREKEVEGRAYIQRRNTSFSTAVPIGSGIFKGKVDSKDSKDSKDRKAKQAELLARYLIKDMRKNDDGTYYPWGKNFAEITCALVNKGDISYYDSNGIKEFAGFKDSQVNSYSGNIDFLTADQIKKIAIFIANNLDVNPRVIKYMMEKDEAAGKTECLSTSM